MGFTTGQSASARLFPAWAKELGLGDVRLVGCDLPIHAAPERYREVVQEIKRDGNARGGLVTTHKVDLFAACHDLFDEIDESSELCGETSCLAKRSGRLVAFATDLVSSGQALAEFYPANGGEVLCLGGGGSATAITLHLIRNRAASRITVVNRTAARLAAMEEIHARLGGEAELRYIENEDPRINDGLVSSLPAGSLVINATGMGKDRPGSPITDAAVFPERGYVWELNYRGELMFLQQARRQAAERRLHVEDGWRYFIHGWAVVLERVFEIEIGPDRIARLAAISALERP